MARVGARPRGIGSRGFWLAVAAVLIAFVVVRLVTSERGQAILARTGITTHFTPQLADRLDVALAQRMVRMGLVRGDIKVRRTDVRGRSVREYAFPCPQHLTLSIVQAELQRATRAAHAQVLSGELAHERTEVLILVLGFGRTPTHRLVIREPPPPDDVAGAPRKPRLALIIDDFGHNMNATTRGLLDLGVPMTIAVLPELGRSKAAFAAAQERGIPALLHLPMEPEGHEDPGKHPVVVGMSAEDVDALVARYVRRYGTFIGVNNHMGSRATADTPTMAVLMRALRRQGLFFVDSQTTPHSAARHTARQAGVWCIANDLFLDDGEESAQVVTANLEQLAALARKRGLAVGIGHPHAATLAALRATLPRLQAHGIELVTVADLLASSTVAAREARR